MLKKYFSLIALFIAIAITLYFFSIMRMFSSTRTSFGHGDLVVSPTEDTAFGGIFANINFNDSLPYYTYKYKEDSLNRIEQAREFNNKGQGIAGITCGALGVYTIVDEVLDRGILKEERPDSEKHYYLALIGYNLDNRTKFYIDNNTYNLAYPKWDSINKFGTKFGHYESKQIKIRYASNNKSILIPISNERYHLFSISLSILSFSILFFFAYIFIGLPIQILFRVSKGDAFNRKNIQSFKLMSIVLFIFTLVCSFVPYFFKFIYQKIIPADFKLQSVPQTFISYLYLYIVCLVLFIITKAFKKGYQLQKEQDLTI